MNALKGFINSKKNELKKSQTEQGWIDRSTTRSQEASAADAKIAEARRLAELAEYFQEPRKSKKREVEHEEASSKRIRIEEEPLPENWSEVEEKLRFNQQPVTLFGETPRDTYRRLREMEEGLTPMEGQRGDETPDTDLEEFLGKRPSLTEDSTALDIPSHLPDTERVRLFIKRCLRRWQEELEERTPAEKNSLEGRSLTNMCQQTRRDLRPLLKKIKEDQLEKEIAVKLAAIVDYCVRKEYVKAHDKYIELAIGNAAWPMGVTMVGIHERVGRSKIFSSEIAHILNDETTRKYIQMIKRLMTLCQTWNATDPSKMVTIATTKATEQATKKVEEVSSSEDESS